MKIMIRVVVDTNVIIAAVLFGGVPEKVLLKILGGQNTLVLSPFIVEETDRILQTKFQVETRHIKLLQQVLTVGDMQYFQPFLQVISDEPDNRIIETAVKGNAGYIVTGDKLLLKLKSYNNIQLITPASFLRI